jgi:WD40 repeat protein
MGAVSADGRLCGIVGNDRCQIFRTDTFAKQSETGLQPGMRFIALSPNGALLASGAWQRSGVRVWDANTGALVKELSARDGDSEATATVVFSPDGRYLVTSIISEYCFWEVGAWTLARRIPQHPDNDFPAAMAFTRDGKIFAGTHSRNVVRLFDAATGNVLADLEAPNSSEVTSISFNHDGTQLAACESRDALRIWDLRLIRKQLADMGLDWEQSTYMPISNGSVVSRGSPLEPSRPIPHQLR